MIQYVELDPYFSTNYINYLIFTRQTIREVGIIGAHLLPSYCTF